MTEVFNWVDQLFAFVVPISNFLWDFPTNYAWYSNIPILGQFSLTILLLLGHRRLFYGPHRICSGEVF